MPAKGQAPANRQPMECLLRLFWMAIGNAVLFLIGVQVFQSDRHLSGLDVAYWLVVILIVGVRFVDMRHFAGTDGLGAPASLKLVSAS